MLPYADRKETAEAYHMKGKSHDCGNKLDICRHSLNMASVKYSAALNLKPRLEEEMGIKK